MSFSTRQGLVRKALQFESMDRELRNGLWNAFHLFVLEPFKYGVRSQSPLRSRNLDTFLTRVWLHVLKWSMTRKPEDRGETLRYLGEWYYHETTPWFRVYDFIEFVSEDLIGDKADEFREWCNTTLETESSAYRFVGEIIAPLTNEAEIDTVVEAVGREGTLSYVATHIKTALQLLSSREHRDYRNSMKEAISAVEALVKIITQDERGTLGRLLQRHGDAMDLHDDQITAYMALYGYSSDDHGIRHALKDDREPALEDARFFLVSCSAFVNYLVEKAVKLRLLT